MAKSDINPMQSAKGCRAHSKRTGQPCRAPAVKGWKVCRMHGAGGGAPSGQANGNYRHGRRTKESMQMKAALRELLRDSRRTVALLK